MPPGPEVALVLVDDRSLAALGRWPLSRHLFAQAVQKAAPEALVAGALHHIPASALLDLETPVLHGDVAVVADDLEAMRATQAMVSAIPELRPLDGGPLQNAIALEAFCAVLRTVNLRYGGKATLRLMPAH